ncbi:hypothetical protein BC831DRAFT_141163 [Entophlyctis helioformis]|nr:hypothetical protein BC831DRAFT_141163 [Entophlyctis helioformis]
MSAVPPTTLRNSKDARKSRLVAERNADIETENKRLLKSIIRIDVRRPKAANQPNQRQPASAIQAPNRFQQQRAKELRKIQEENKRLVKKLESASSKSDYARSKLEGEWTKNRQIIARISTHAQPSAPTGSVIPATASSANVAAAGAMSATAASVSSPSAIQAGGSRRPTLAGEEAASSVRSSLAPSSVSVAADVGRSKPIKPLESKSLSNADLPIPEHISSHTDAVLNDHADDTAVSRADQDDAAAHPSKAAASTNASHDVVAQFQSLAVAPSAEPPSHDAMRTAGGSSPPTTTKRRGLPLAVPAASRMRDGMSKAAASGALMSRSTHLVELASGSAALSKSQQLQGDTQLPRAAFWARRPCARCTGTWLPKLPRQYRPVQPATIIVACLEIVVSLCSVYHLTSCLPSFLACLPYPPITLFLVLRHYRLL